MSLMNFAFLSTQSLKSGPQPLKERGSFPTFVRVVVPQLRPSIVAGSLLVALYTLSDFGAVSMLRYDTFTRAIYTQYRGALNRGSAAVLVGPGDDAAVIAAPDGRVVATTDVLVEGEQVAVAVEEAGGVETSRALEYLLRAAQSSRECLDDCGIDGGTKG